MENFFYDPSKRLLYAEALEERYRQSGNWPSEGFIVDAATAQAFVEHPERDEMEIVLDADGVPEIVPIEPDTPEAPEEPTTPVDPVEPETPQEAEVPEDPAGPDEAEAPAESEEPTAPTKPEAEPLLA
ncbi:hypothetical protein D9M68_851890 [compost metagenome]